MRRERDQVGGGTLKVGRRRMIHLETPQGSLIRTWNENVLLLRQRFGERTGERRGSKAHREALMDLMVSRLGRLALIAVIELFILLYYPSRP